MEEEFVFPKCDPKYSVFSADKKNNVGRQNASSITWLGQYEVTDILEASNKLIMPKDSFQIHLRKRGFPPGVNCSYALVLMFWEKP